MIITSAREARNHVTQTHGTRLNLDAQSIPEIGWLISPARDQLDLALGAASYLVLTDGRVTVVAPRESVRDAYERLVSGPKPGEAR